MRDDRDFDRAVDRWLRDGSDVTPPWVTDAVMVAARSTPQERDFRLSWRTSAMVRLAYSVAAVVAVAIGVTILSALGTRLGIGPDPTPPPVEPSVDLGIFEPVAGWIVYGDEQGIWGVDPAAPADPATRVRLTPEAGIPLGWSSDGTRLLLRRDGLVVLDADGSETRLTSDWVTDSQFLRAATISPDGSRVVLATIDGPGDTGALLSVDADGGIPEVLLERDGLEGVSFSPDGTRIAFVSGHGDGGHRVSIMDAGGSNVREILANDVTLAGGHDHGIAWSPAGDRIALGIEGNIYTFAPDGSGFTLARRSGRLQPFWSPDGSQLETKGPWHPGTPSPTVESTTAPSPSLRPTAPAVDAEVNDLLDSFLYARIAGEGAEQYLSVPDDVAFGDVEDIPLLYATSSGDRFERAEFEPVLGINWPYGFAAFKVRLFAGGTVVEQLFFTPHDLELHPDPARTADARPKLEYVLDGFGTDIGPTTENGLPVGVPYNAFDGEVTMRVAHPWVFQYDGAPIRLIPEGAPPTTDGGERNGWDHLVLMADPVRTGTDCPAGPGPADAAALAESIRSDPSLEATAPVAVGVEGAEGLMIDVVRAAGATSGVCGLSGDAELRVRGELDFTGNPVRLYLFDAPEGLSMRILAVAIVVPESRFERAVGAPVSVHFNTP